MCKRVRKIAMICIGVPLSLILWASAFLAMAKGFSVVPEEFRWRAIGLMALGWAISAFAYGFSSSFIKDWWNDKLHVTEEEEV